MAAMSQFEEYEAELRLWTNRLKLIDALLQGPVQTILSTIEKAGFTVPSTLSEERTAKTATAQAPLLVHAACCSMLERIHLRRRRFPWVRGKQTSKLMADVLEPFLAIERDSEGDPYQLMEKLQDDVFGTPNALTSAEIFWVLIKAGEKHAHGPLGFFCLFGIFWALLRGGGQEWSGGVTAGASLEPWRPSALVTAKCLLPLRRLTDILRERASLYRKIAEAYRQLGANKGARDTRQRWEFTLAIEQLASHLQDFAAVAINPDEFLKRADIVSRIAGRMTSHHPAWELNNTYNRLTVHLRSLLYSSAKTAEPLLTATATLLKNLPSKVIAHLRPEADHGPENPLYPFCPQLLWTSDEKYWKEHHAAAESAHAWCSKALEALQRGVAECNRQAQDSAETPDVADSLEVLAKVNVEVARTIEAAVRPSVHWMRAVITREVASASAGDETTFDAAELLSGLAIVQRWSRISDLETEDAVRWSLKAARSDGSWASGQPILMKQRVLGVWPNTPDIVWLLAMAIERKKKITVADEKLFAFVNWLDKTKIDLAGEGAPLSGWPSETRDRDTVDVWSTTLSINALLSIRDLVEERLWALCERRFLVKKMDLKPLSEIDPVDLGAQHSERLHHRLLKMARQTRSDASAEYALVLHGPPGSSKTALAEAFATEMWKGTRERRLVRITPADFTRQGEERVDSEARFIFDLLSHVRGATIFFDEIDQLLQRRRPGGHISFLELVVPAMLNRLQDLRDAAPRQELAFLFATNFVDTLDPALTRPGRIDAAVPVPYPDPWSRENIMLRNFGKTDPLDATLRRHLVDNTAAWPWSTFNKLCRAIVSKPPRDPRDLDEAISERGSDFEETETYYGDPARWTTPSRSFSRELIHATFAFSRSREECLGKLMEIAGRAGMKEANVQHLGALFAHEWGPRSSRFESRSEPAPQPPHVTGTAPDRRMGVTIGAHSAHFRVWAPHADQVAVAGDFNGWSNTWNPLTVEDNRRFFSGYVPDVFLDDEVRQELSADPAEKSTTADTVAVPPPEPPPPAPVKATHPGVLLRSAPVIPAMSDEEPREPDDEYEEETPHVVGQYRYVITTSGEEELWRTDPYAEELAYIGRYRTVNAVLTSPSKAADTPFEPLPPERLVMYQIHPATFTADGLRRDGLGTLRSARQKIADLAVLGVNAIEILMTGDRKLDLAWGYDAAFPCAIRSHCGGASALRDFIDAAHTANIAVCIGVVWHRLGETNDPLRGLWRYDGWRAERATGGIYFRSNDPGTAPAVEQLEVRNLLYDTVMRWADDKRIDGFRWREVSQIPLIESDGRALLQAATRSLREKKRFTIGDAAPAHMGDGVFDALADHGFAEAVRRLITARGTASSLPSVIPSAAGFGRVIAIEDHRSASSGRLAAAVDSSERSRAAAMAATLLLTAPGIPVIFQGQETLDVAPFTATGTIDWSEADSGMRSLYRDLIRLRVSDPDCSALRSPETAVSVDDQAGVVRIRRTSPDGGHAIVLLNLRSQEHYGYRVPAPVAGKWRVRFNSNQRAYGSEMTDFGSAEVLAGAPAAESSPYSFIVDIGGLSAMILAPDRAA